MSGLSSGITCSFAFGAGLLGDALPLLTQKSHHRFVNNGRHWTHTVCAFMCMDRCFKKKF